MINSVLIYPMFRCFDYVLGIAMQYMGFRVSQSSQFGAPFPVALSAVVVYYTT